MLGMAPARRSLRLFQPMHKALADRRYAIGAPLRPGRVSKLLGRPLSSSQIRRASTETTLTSGLTNLLYGTSLILGLGIVYLYITDTRASVHRWVVVPALRLIYRDAEDAHHAGNEALKVLWTLNLHPRERGDPDAKGDLGVDIFGHNLDNPLAISAGLDKHADIPDILFAVGPGIVEIGGVTPLPQPGNDKPRVFRLASQYAIINRYGLNSEGADHIAARLRLRVREFAQSLGLGRDKAAEEYVLNGGAGVPPGSLTEGRLLAVNIAKNKDTPGDDVHAVTQDYVSCVDRLGPYADILVVNVSSPNTPGLRNLQKVDTLKQILTGVVQAAKSVDRATKPAVMVKVSPDEDSDEQIAGVCEAVWSSGVDGVIVGNTTNRRPDPLPYLAGLTPSEQQRLLEKGGFSGPHLFDKTVKLVTQYKKLLSHKPADIESDLVRVEEDNAKVDESAIEQAEREEPGLRRRLQSVLTALDQLQPHERKKASDEAKVIFATGGISNGNQAREVLHAGADVAMVYTAMVYGGIGTITRIKQEIRGEIAQQDAQTTQQGDNG
ncbi:hypothetical protein DV736_g5843, partial [Chaetothyriales sp. CBS 134916]